ncbi:MAG: alpha/beta hydrolase [Legionellaceae bacterium]|nr:alpha/beta hydrolase [Legionellaceae bacterium]
MVNNLKWVVVPGGPGLGNGYLKNSLPNIFRGYDLRFYEPFGAPGSVKPTPTVIEMIEQLEGETGNKEDFGLITHSFGNYLALRVLERNNNNLKAIIMLNPIPFTIDSWKMALAELISQLSEATLEKIIALSQDSSDGAELFRLIYPFYVNTKKNSLPFDVPFNISSCNAISEQVQSFDEYLLMNNSDVPMIRVVGEQDVFYCDHEVMKDRTYVLNDTGHYPFFEGVEQFLTKIPNIEKKLCQMMPKMTTRFI